MAKDDSHAHEDLNAMCGHTCQRQSTLPSNTHTRGSPGEDSKHESNYPYDLFTDPASPY